MAIEKLTQELSVEIGRAVIDEARIGQLVEEINDELRAATQHVTRSELIGLLVVNGLTDCGEKVVVDRPAPPLYFDKAKTYRTESVIPEKIRREAARRPYR